MLNPLLDSRLDRPFDNKVVSKSKTTRADSPSLYGVAQICFPLILSAFSSTFMIFLDRIILAKYDTQAMISATTAGNLLLIFQHGAFYIAMTAEVWVGRFNGAKQYQDIAKPVWQMIWFALFCTSIMIPVGLFMGKWLIPDAFALDGIPYFKWMMIFGGTSPLIAALSAFYIGRKQVKLVMMFIISGNLLNVGLAFAFVFGLSPFIEPMGAKGAAIASGLSQSCIALGLLLAFLKKSNRIKFNTHHWAFDWAILSQCFKLGLPNAIGHVIATAAWAMVLALLAKKSTDHVTVMSIGMSIWLLFAFVTEGLQQGMTSLAANYIGAGKQGALDMILKTGLQLQFLIAMLLSIPLVFFPEIIIGWFFPQEAGNLQEVLEMSCRWLWVAYLFDGMAWVIDGILTALGDTRFIMFMNSFGTWLFFILPIYFFIIKLAGTPILTLQLIALFCFILFSSYALRYKSLKKKST